MNWRSVLDYKDTIRFTSEWYKNYYSEPVSVQIKTINQIIEYENLPKDVIVLAPRNNKVDDINKKLNSTVDYLDKKINTMDKKIQKIEKNEKNNNLFKLF